VEALHTLASSLLNRGDLEKAIEQAGRALELEGMHAEIHLVRGVALYQKAVYDTTVRFQESSREQEAVDELREARRLDGALPDIGAHLAAADVHLARRNLVRGNVEAALTNASEATLVDEHSADAWETLAMARHARGSLHDAIAASRKATSLRSEDPCIRAHQAVLLEEGADPEATPEDARRAAQIATDLDPGQDHADHWLALAEACCELGHWEGALEAAEHAARLREQDPAAAFLLARARFELLDDAGADAAFTQGDQWLREDRIRRNATCSWRTDASQRSLRARLRSEAERTLERR